MEDRRGVLGLAGRRRLVRLIEGGCSLRSAAAQSGVAVATAHRWWHRWLRASSEDRLSGAWARSRSTRPGSCPWQLTTAQEAEIVSAREKTNWGPMRLAWLTGRHRSTCWKVLKRHGLNRQRRTERPMTTRRYEWTDAGALLHIDAFELPKFDRPGHWAHGDRSEQHKTRRAGKVKVIGVIDDHTRLAYCELHSGETAAAVSATLTRAAAWMRDQGCGPVEAVMSDNAKCYATSHQFRDTLDRFGARHILIPPRTPRWNGKIERFFRTLDTEWAHARVWPTSRARDRALASYLRFYNKQRPHTAAAGRAPITRVHQLHEQHN